MVPVTNCMIVSRTWATPNRLFICCFIQQIVQQNPVLTSTPAAPPSGGSQKATCPPESLAEVHPFSPLSHSPVLTSTVVRFCFHLDRNSALQQVIGQSPGQAGSREGSRKRGTCANRDRRVVPSSIRGSLDQPGRAVTASARGASALRRSPCANSFPDSARSGRAPPSAVRRDRCSRRRACAARS